MGEPTDDDRETIENWVRGIDSDIWTPTPATKRHLARVLRQALDDRVEVERLRAAVPASEDDDVEEPDV